ncbi:unnamed protein product, partial [Brassica rapa subsp. narinosa]
MIHVLQMSFLIIRLESILEDINKVGDMGVVHILVADERVVCIDPVEAHELMLEVVHEEVVENNNLRQPYKTLLLVLEIFKDKAYNNFFLFPKHTKFYWKCLNTFKELLQALTRISYNEDIPKELGLGQSYQNQHFGGYIAKCKTVRHTTKSTTLECTIWFSTVGNTAKCSIVEHTTKYTTVRHITDLSIVVHTVKCTIIGGTANYTKMGNIFEC